MKLPKFILLDNKRIKKQASCPLVIGFFDGIHMGHLKLFKSLGDDFNILTFVNIPSKQNTLFPISSRLTNMTYLNPMPKNIFIYDLKKHNDVNFFIKILKKYITPTKIIVGNHFTYGKNKQYD
jgi:riboflavin kinase/FMN adenylyltransferase